MQGRGEIPLPLLSWWFFFFSFLFSLLPCIHHTFNAGTSEHSTYIVQTLDFHLGHNTMVTKPCGALESPMATITKITRRRHENPPHGVASVKEWFNYVTATRNEGKIHIYYILRLVCLSVNAHCAKLQVS